MSFGFERWHIARWGVRCHVDTRRKKGGHEEEKDTRRMLSVIIRRKTSTDRGRDMATTLYLRLSSM